MHVEYGICVGYGIYSIYMHMVYGMCLMMMLCISSMDYMWNMEYIFVLIRPILFVCEAARGGANEHEGSRRIKSEFLVQMDGMSWWQQEP